MQRKTLVFGLLGLMGVLVVLAYAAGQQSNRLSAEQTNFNGYQSENHAKRLTAQVWDATMNALTTWAKNHESRLQVHGSVPGYPDLTQEQLSFSNLLSTQHNNALTAQMRDGLLNKFTATITNHEMRLRALENKPVVKNGSCVGEYQDGTTSGVHGKKVPRREIECKEFVRNRPGQIYPREACDKALIGEEYAAENQRGRPNQNGKTFMYVWYQDGDFFNASSECLTKDLGSNGRWGNRIEIDFDSCRYSCSGRFASNTRFCETVTTPIKKSCSDLNETACKVKSGCTWKQ